MRKPAANPNANKRCIACAQDKPITSFLPGRFVVGGRLSTCKSCTFERAERDRHYRETRRRTTANSDAKL